MMKYWLHGYRHPEQRVEIECGEDECPACEMANMAKTKVGDLSFVVIEATASRPKRIQRVEILEGSRTPRMAFCATVSAKYADAELAKLAKFEGGAS